MGDPREVGVTNLGPVPKGMTFCGATAAVAHRRKYRINPEHRSNRLTICETLREIHRIAERAPEPDRSNLLLLVGAAFDYAKKMDARMKELKAVLPDA